MIVMRRYDGSCLRYDAILCPLLSSSMDFFIVGKID
jgi:hypothetical protein